MLWSTLIDSIPTKKNKLKYANNRMLSDQILHNKSDTPVSANDIKEYDRLSAMLDERERSKSSFRKRIEDYRYRLCIAIYKTATRNWPTDPKDIR